MKQAVRSRAAVALIKCKCTTKQGWGWFPKVYIVGEEIYFPRHAAETAVECALLATGKAPRIETLTFQEAWNICFNEECPEYQISKICNNIFT